MALKQLTGLGAIKMFFKLPGKSECPEDYKPVSLKELQSLNATERDEMGQLVAQAMGLTIGSMVEVSE